jgi:endonuclease/exonuclease/phosphatase family metal-dependent hydrolase
LLAEQFHAVAHDYQLNVHLKEGGYGNLILSRWPFKSHHHISLRYKTSKPRGAQLAIIDTPEGLLHLAHWHLSLTARMRLWQSNHLLAHRLFHEGHHLPTLIIGDTNDWRNQLWKVPFHDHGYRQITAPPAHFRSFPAYLPLGSLDKAFCKGPIEVRHAGIVKIPVAKRASDHLPLVIDFHLTPEKTS